MRTEKDKPSLGIYIHIPFCRRKCAYCDFLSFSAGEETIRAYLDALHAQIASFEMAGQYRPVSIFIGGGTPSILTGGQIFALLQEICRRFAIRDPAALEITVECNPGTLDADKLSAMRAAGVSRLSIGVQSLDDTLLRTLGRIHNREVFLQSYTLARESGFANINLDLMSALPDQTPAMWEETLLQAAALRPEHISAYSLMVEDGTPFAQLYGKSGPLLSHLPDEETDRAMYHMTKEILEGRGYERYEISNYAKPGAACIHNEGYWLRREYVGFGLGAASQLENIRCKNTDSFSRYLMLFSPDSKGAAQEQGPSGQEQAGALKEQARSGQEHADAGQDFGLREYLKTQEEIEYLTENNCIEETMFLGLRRMAGVDLQQFEERFGCSVYDVYQDLPGKLEKEGLLETDGHALRLTDYGIDISNYVMAQFFKPERNRTDNEET